MKVRAKFAISCSVAMLWMAFSMYFALPWIVDISAQFGSIFAWASVIGIAIIPGIVMMLVNISLLLDRRPKYEKLTNPPPVSILIAAYNEEDNIFNTLHSILNQEYNGDIKVIVVNDGSTDNTANEVKNVIKNQELMKEIKSDVYNNNVEIKLYNYNNNTGKANRLNDGLSFAKTEFIITLDADSTLLSPHSLLNIVTNIVNKDENVVAVAGTVLCKNNKKSIITRIQEWDYLHGIASVKRIQSMYHGTLVAQGAFSIYRKWALVEAGGWPDKIGEDIVLTWGFHNSGYKIDYEETAICYTNVPETYKEFYRQRKRWARGLIEAFKSYPRNLFRLKMSTVFIWYNFFFPYIDFVFLFVFLPGVIAALFFSYYLFASMMTLYLLPLAFLGNFIIYFIQKMTLKKMNIEMPKNLFAFIFYMLFFQLIMTPATLSGYVSELLKRKRVW